MEWEIIFRDIYKLVRVQGVPRFRLIVFRLHYCHIKRTSASLGASYFFPLLHRNIWTVVVW